MSVNDEHYENLLELAKCIAKAVHENQVDKGGKPYYLHPFAVADGCTGIYAKIVAYLHDTIEDTAVTADTLRSLGFDEFLVDAVLLVTKDKENPDYSIERYFAKIKENPIAREVKLADLRHNLDRSRVPNPGSTMLKKWAQYEKMVEFLEKEGEEK